MFYEMDRNFYRTAEANVIAGNGIIAAGDSMVPSVIAGPLEAILDPGAPEIPVEFRPDDFGDIIVLS